MIASLGDIDADSARAAEVQLRANLRELGPCLVAYSAGVDSTYLLAVAHQELGANAVAVTADSPSLARRSLNQAQHFCAERGIEHRVVATDEFNDQDYVNNTGQRCYACKAALFRAMDDILNATKAERGNQALLLGALTEDFADYRPGLQAAREAGAQWPLADAGMDKRMVRWLSREMGLDTWDRPAEPCLSSRVAYGEPVDQLGLSMIERAESILHDRGFQECRARHHLVAGGQAHLCRIEVPSADLERLLADRDAILPAIISIGYHNVTIDLAGLQSGGFNDLVQ